MSSLIAQNGLAYTVNLIFLMTMSTDEFKQFSNLFGTLVDFVEKINDDGIVIYLTLNINEELSKLGRFKDVPSKTEINNYMPIILESEIFLKSDIQFLKKVVELYIIKETFKHNKANTLVHNIERKISKAIEHPYVQIRNLIMNP